VPSARLAAAAAAAHRSRDGRGVLPGHCAAAEASSVSGRGCLPCGGLRDKRPHTPGS
jgi:hypothetical protein